MLEFGIQSLRKDIFPKVGTINIRKTKQKAGKYFEKQPDTKLWGFEPFGKQTELNKTKKKKS